MILTDSVDLLFGLDLAVFMVEIYYLSIQDASAMVIDHTSYAVSSTNGDHTLIASDDFINSDVILGSKKIEASA